MPKIGVDGCPFGGPGVDLVGDDADEALSAAEALLAVLRELEPGASVRSVSVDLESRRLLGTLAPAREEVRPRAFRIDSGAVLERALEASGHIEAVLAGRARAALERRAR